MCGELDGSEAVVFVRNDVDRADRDHPPAHMPVSLVGVPTRRKMQHRNGGSSYPPKAGGPERLLSAAA